MPFADPEDRYVHVRADRAALAALRAAHPEEYRLAYEAESELVRARMRAVEEARGRAPADGDGGGAAEVPDRDDGARYQVDGGVAAHRADDASSPQGGTADPAPAAANERAAAFAKPPGRPTKAARKPPKKAPNLKPEPPPPPPSFTPEPPPPPPDEPVVEYQPDPAVEPDPSWPTCPACGLGISRHMACGCSPGELDDDGVPLDPRFTHLGPVE